MQNKIKILVILIKVVQVQTMQTTNTNTMVIRIYKDHLNNLNLKICQWFHKDNLNIRQATLTTVPNSPFTITDNLLHPCNKEATPWFQYQETVKRLVVSCSRQTTVRKLYNPKLFSAIYF